MTAESLFSLEPTNKDEEIRQDKEDGILKTEKLSKEEIFAMLPEGTDKNLIEEHNGEFFIEGEPINLYLDHQKKEEQEAEEEKELFEIEKEKNIHRSLLKKTNGKWLACDIGIEEFLKQRESISNKYHNVDVKYLSKKENKWYVLYHTKEYPIEEWEKIKEDTVVDMHNKTAKQFLLDNNINLNRYMTILENLVLINDREWKVYRLGKFFDILEWKEEVKADEEYNNNDNKLPYYKGQH